MKINDFIPYKDLSKLGNVNLINENEEKKASDGSFSSILTESLNSVNDKQINADNITESFIKGDETDIHDVMLATEDAKMSMELAIQMRNKIVEAYQELNRIQI